MGREDEDGAGPSRTQDPSTAIRERGDGGVPVRVPTGSRVLPAASLLFPGPWLIPDPSAPGRGKLTRSSPPLTLPLWPPGQTRLLGPGGGGRLYLPLIIFLIFLDRKDGGPYMTSPFCPVHICPWIAAPFSSVPEKRLSSPSPSAPPPHPASSAAPWLLSPSALFLRSSKVFRLHKLKCVCFHKRSCHSPCGPACAVAPLLHLLHPAHQGRSAFLEVSGRP